MYINLNLFGNKYFKISLSGGKNLEQNIIVIKAKYPLLQ